jgi:hypothetical protein
MIYDDVELIHDNNDDFDESLPRHIIPSTFTVTFLSTTA